jgi:hypothetical protein
MEQQNVTLTLPADLLREARHLAVDRGVSLSKFLALLLAEHIESVKRYNEARERQLSLMNQGIDLGTHGNITWSREDLHDR